MDDTWADLWLIDLDAADAPDGLDAAEQAQAARFVRPQDARRYRAAHGWMRHLLALHLGIDGLAVAYHVLPHGKPVLANGLALPFSLSHSGRLGALLIGSDQPVGVDVELLDRQAGMQALQGQFMSPLERSALLALPANQQDLASLTCWTRKEAVLKAVGCGLHGEPREVTVGLDHSTQAVSPLLAHDARTPLVQSQLIVEPLPACLSACRLLASPAEAPAPLQLRIRAASRSGGPA